LADFNGEFGERMKGGFFYRWSRYKISGFASLLRLAVDDGRDTGLCFISRTSMWESIS